MSDPNKSLSGPLPFDFLPELRADIQEAMGMAGIYAGMAQDFAAVADDAGLAYTLRRFMAYTRAAIGSFNDLADILKRNETSEAA